MPTKPDPEQIETAKANANLATAHAETAAQSAADAEQEAAKLEAAEQGTHACPDCGAPLVKHGDANPYKKGASHCNSCGKCWAPGLKHER